MNQDAPTPAMLTATADVELALLLAFTLFQDGDVVGPADFSHKLCEFFISAIGFVEVLHAPEICGGKAIGPRKLFAEIAGQVVDDTLTPRLPLLPLDDHPSDICVQRDLLSIDRA
jgi:hypothetical protein